MHMRSEKASPASGPISGRQVGERRLARRLVFAEAEDPEWVRTRYSLQVDDYVEVHWKLPMAIDDWSGEVSVADPGYEITLRGELPAGPLQVYGRLANAEDLEWLSKAVRADPKKRLIARVNEVQTGRPNGRLTGFQIEVLTGPDAQSLEDAERLRRNLQFLRQYWWVVVLAVLVIWWWVSRTV
jgi:hypothetical protein